jgi:hypothetical protein
LWTDARYVIKLAMNNEGAWSNILNPENQNCSSIYNRTWFSWWLLARRGMEWGTCCNVR